MHRDPRGAEGLVDGAPGGRLGFEAGPKGVGHRPHLPAGEGHPLIQEVECGNREAPWAREDAPTSLSRQQVGRGAPEARGPSGDVRMAVV